MKKKSKFFSFGLAILLLWACDYLFENNDPVKDLEVREGMVSGFKYAQKTKYKVLVIPSHINGELITSIRAGAFRGCSLTTVTLPNSVNYIGSNAFENCISLTTIKLPNYDALRESKGSKINFNFYTSVLIGDYAFKGCKSLKKINLKERISSIGKGAFAGTSLETIDISFVMYAVNGFAGCKTLKTATLHRFIESIENSAFQGCTALSKVNFSKINLPSELQTIENYAFQDCTSLKALNIPNSVRSIGNYAFQNCSSLKDITLPLSITAIGWYAFENCHSLTITLTQTNPAKIELPSDAFWRDDQFKGIKKIRVPKASLQAYKTADPWKNWAGIMEGY